MFIKEKKVPFLGSKPTPIDYLPTLSEEFGIEFYIKRDDMTPFGMGGNKLRKLEYLLYDAKEKGATVLLTVGGAQTNHGRLTAAVAAKYGLKCVIVCIDDYPGEVSANILLDRIMGAEVVLKKSDGRDLAVQLSETIEKVKERYEKQGDIVYEIPMGGSNAIGAMGYFECAGEITAQAEKMGISDATIFTAVGSIGTYLGLYTGLKTEKSPLGLTGVAILPFDEKNDKRLIEYFNEIKESYNLSIEASREDFHIETGYVRDGYNKIDENVRNAIYKMGRSEAVILDPCYTGKLFAGILDMIKEGKIKKGEKIIMIHTGGMPGIYTRHHREEFEKELISGITLIDQE